MVYCGIVLAAVFASFAFGGNIAHSESSCSTYCDKTYSPHTSLDLGEVKSCNRGCRMFQIILFTTRKNETATHQACDEACTEAYASGSDRDACRDGCKHQSPLGDKSGHFEVVITDQKDPMYKYAHNMMDNVMNDIDSLHDRFLGGFGQIKQMLGFGEDEFGVDAEMMRMEKAMNSLMNRQHSFMDRQNDFLRSWGIIPSISIQPLTSPLRGDPDSNPLYQYGNRLHSGSSGSYSDNTNVGNLNGDGNAIIHVAVVGPFDVSTSSFHDKSGTARNLYDTKPHDPSTIDVTRVSDPADSWMTYLAHRTGHLSSVTRWLLFFAMTLCIVSMVWICLAIVKTAPMIQRRSMMIATKKYDMPPCVESGRPYSKEAEAHASSDVSFIGVSPGIHTGVAPIKFDSDKAYLLQHVCDTDKPPQDESGAPPPYSPRD